MKAQKQEKEGTNDSSTDGGSKEREIFVNGIQKSLIAKCYINDPSITQNMMREYEITSKTAQKKALKKMDLAAVDRKILKQLLRKSKHIKHCLDSIIKGTPSPGRKAHSADRRLRSSSLS